MRVLLIRPKVKRQASSWVMKVEPLELEMLSTYLRDKTIHHQIYDQVLEGTRVLRKIKQYQPTHIIYTSYVTSVDEINEQAYKIKKRHKHIQIIVGGAHTVLNAQDFYKRPVDAIIHSGGIQTIGQILNLPKAEWRGIKGIAYQREGAFIKNEPAPSDCYKGLFPNREHLLKHRDKWRYLEKKEIALLKTAYGCPHHCEFCYCRLMEEGYIPRTMDEVLAEIEEIPFENIWIVDDTFLVAKNRVEDFIAGIKERKIHKHFIIYGRADFISREKELMKQLRAIGVEEVIVGLEAVDNKTLQDFHKQVEIEENRRCIAVLNEVGIRCTGLFIYPLEATWDTVRQILRFIKETSLYNATFSIFTPLKGTKLYGLYEKRLLTKAAHKYNFLHVVVRPTETNIVSYKLGFYILNIGALYLMLCQRIKRRMEK